MRISICLLLLSLLACGPGAPPPEPENPADLVVMGANLVTLDQPAEAMAVRDGKIIALGTRDEIKAMIGKETNQLMLDGMTVIPGFIEGHGHLLAIGDAKMNLELMPVKTWAGITAMVAEAVKTAEPGEWILGRGWHQEKFDPQPQQTVEGYPLHDAISAVSPDNPVLLGHASGHAVFANAKAMELAGVTAATKDPAGGKIVRDESGNPIGVFEENAESLVRQAYNEWAAKQTEEEKLARRNKALQMAIKECLAKGITSFQDAGSTYADVDLYKAAVDAGNFDMRLWVMLGESNESLQARGKDYVFRDYGDGMLTVGGIKRYADGALGARGAWLLDEYTDLKSHFGQNVMPMETIEETARIAKDLGLQLCTHAIGDRGNREVLDIYERVLSGEDKRWRIEHAQHLNPEDIPRFAELGVIASMQGVHCTSDAPFVEKRLGPERAESGAYVWRSLKKTGAVVSNGTDAPVEDVDPLPSFYAHVTRRYAPDKVFYPAQTLSAMEALKSYTLDTAYAAYEENQKGSLTVGKFADFVVLSQDITKINPEKIKETQILMTIVGGDVKYRAN